MHRVTYKGYEIHALPQPLASGGWEPTLYIRMGRQGRWREKQVSALRADFSRLSSAWLFSNLALKAVLSARAVS